MGNNKPKQLLIFKIVGFIGIIVGIVGIGLAINGFNADEGSLFMIDGFTEPKIYCKHCGASIDADSNFCSNCGKEV